MKMCNFCTSMDLLRRWVSIRLSYWQVKWRWLRSILILLYASRIRSRIIFTLLSRGGLKLWGMWVFIRCWSIFRMSSCLRKILWFRNSMRKLSKMWSKINRWIFRKVLIMLNLLYMRIIQILFQNYKKTSFN